MKKISHTAQQQAWDREHKKPNVLRQMHSENPSSGVEKFLEFLEKEHIPRRNGIEMGCGKGRNVIWLLKHGVEMTGFDFSPAAIKEAQKRAKKEKTVTAKFVVADATKKWPFDSEIFDIGIDCFASTDIESEKARKYAVSEMFRVLKRGGYLMIYMHAVGGEFHKRVTSEAPGSERNSFLRGEDKCEKIFDKTEVRNLFKDFQITRFEIIDKSTAFEGKEYANKHFWAIFRRPH